jgi:hypothetical protein
MANGAGKTVMELPLAKDCHDHGGMSVSIAADLQALMLAEFARDGQDREIAWALFGRRHEGFSVFCAVRCEKSETKTQVEFDHEKLVAAADKLEDAFGDVDLLGQAHSHPTGVQNEVPSPTDHAADMAWLSENEEDAGVFALVSAKGLSWFVMERQFGTYAAVTVMDDKMTAWKKWQEVVDA